MPDRRRLRCSVSLCFYRANISSCVSAIVLGYFSSPLVLSCLSRRHASCYTPATVTAAATSPLPLGIIYPVCFLCRALARDAPSREKFHLVAPLTSPSTTGGEYQPPRVLVVSSPSLVICRAVRAPYTKHFVSPRVRNTCRRTGLLFNVPTVLSAFSVHRHHMLRSVGRRVGRHVSFA